jgi:trehalose-6-phosphatase
VLDFYVERTPGSTLMASDVTLLWSWAGAQPDSEFGDAVARDVLAHLDSLLYGQNAEVLPSRCRRYLLVRPVCLSKGALLARGLTPTQPFFTLIAGSDRDDEEMMAFARGEGGWAIAVGACAPPYGADSGAPWMLPNPDALLDTLEALVG